MKGRLATLLAIGAAVTAFGAGPARAADITCQINAYGIQEEPEVSFVVGKTFGHGSGMADAECVSLTQSTYSLNLTESVEALVDNSWVSVGCSRTSGGVVKAGVGEVSPATVSCSASDPYLGHYQRIRATLTNTVDGVVRTVYSNTWWESAR